METNKKIKGIDIQLIISKYNELGNVWKVGEYFGIAGQTIHAELSKLGIIKKINTFTNDDERILIEQYEHYKKRQELQLLADKLGRTKQFICRKAKELGLTSKKNEYELSEESHRKLSESAKKRIKEHGHPKGMKGKHHSEETKEKFSKSSKERWIKNGDLWRDDEHRKARSDRMMQMQEDRILGERSRCCMKEVFVGCKTFVVKSSWEFDIALYLDHLKSNGLVDDWNYEPITFKFKYNKLGVRSYRPDFGVTRKGKVYYIEVKGWEDEKFKIKKQLMKTEFPKVRILYLKEREYRMIEKKYKHILPEWGSMLTT